MVLLAHFELATIFFCAMFCRGVAKGKIGETIVGLTKIITKFTDISIKMVAEGTVDVRDFQKKIGIFYRIKQICRFTILNT